MLYWLGMTYLSYLDMFIFMIFLIVLEIFQSLREVSELYIGYLGLYYSHLCHGLWRFTFQDLHENKIVYQVE